MSTSKSLCRSVWFQPNCLEEALFVSQNSDIMKLLQLMFNHPVQCVHTVCSPLSIVCLACTPHSITHETAVFPGKNESIVSGTSCLSWYHYLIVKKRIKRFNSNDVSMSIYIPPRWYRSADLRKSALCAGSFRTLLFCLATQTCSGKTVCVTSGFVQFHQQLFNWPVLKNKIFSGLIIFLAAITATQSRNPNFESTLMKCTTRGMAGHSPAMFTHSSSHVLVHSPHPCKPKQSTSPGSDWTSSHVKEV